MFVCGLVFCSIACSDTVFEENSNREIDSKSSKINYTVYDWNNTSIIRNDLKTVKYFQKIESMWKIDSVILTDTHNHCIVEIIASDNQPFWIRGVYNKNNPEIQIVTVTGNRFLCVFNDGTTGVSNKFQKHYGYRMHFIIECDITKDSKLRNKLYKQWLYPTEQDLHNSNNNSNNNSDLKTNIGLTLFSNFSLNPKLSDIDNDKDNNNDGDDADITNKALVAPFYNNTQKSRGKLLSAVAVLHHRFIFRILSSGKNLVFQTRSRF